MRQSDKQGWRRLANWAVGFTLIELMVTLSILTILLTVGVAGMSQIVARNARVTEINAMIGHLNFARTEAVSRATDIIVCPVDPSDIGAGCTDDRSGWARGYAVIDAESLEVLRFQKGVGHIDIFSNIDRFTYEDDGTLTTAAGGSIFFCDSRDDAANDASRGRDIVAPRRLLVSGPGRVRIAETPNIDCS